MVRRVWAKWELMVMEHLYPHIKAEKVAAILGRTVCSVNGTATKLGLKKSTVYLATPDACRLRRGGSPASIATRFAKGMVPHNKGVKRPGWSTGRMAETQFKKGSKPQTWNPIGHERLSKEGYLQRKVTDTSYTPADYVEVHRLVWEEANGTIPANHVIVFRDGNRQNVALGNLEMISRRDLMLRNTSQRWGPEVFKVIQLRGAINRQIRNKERAHEEQNDRPA